jgi:hypothetical protein
MQLEWQKRIISYGAGKKRILLDAVLLKGADCGGPDADKEPCILGTMDERFLLVREFDLQAFHLGLFWKEVTQNLDRLGLTSVLRADLECQIEEKITKPPEDWALWPKRCSLACLLKNQNPKPV